MQLPFSLDPGRLVSAFALAVLLYFFALNETNPEITRQPAFAVPVEVVNVPAGLVLTERPQAVQLRVRAPLDVFNRLRVENFIAQADATNARTGEADLPVSVRANDVDVRDVSAVPPRVRVLLEEVQERSLPVRVNVVGQPPSGYQAGTPKTDPTRVTVGGPASVVRRAYEAIVDVNVDRVTVSVDAVFTPRIVDERGNELRDIGLRTNSVNVQVPITQQAQFKEVGVRPKIEGRPAAGYFLEPVEVDPATVTLFGEPAALEGANFVETQPIDVNGISSTVVRRVALVPPQNTLLVQQGQMATVTVKVSPLTITQTLRVQPSVIDVPSGLLVSGQPEPVDVTISGPAPTLSNLTARDFRVVVSAGGKGPGRQQLEPRVQNLPQGMTLDQIQPRTVTVELREAPTPTPAPTPPPEP